MKYINEYNLLPDFLLNAVAGTSRSVNAIQPRGCVGDITAADCNLDSSCTADCNDSTCYGDASDPDCTVDAGCGYDVKPCSDTPAPCQDVKPCADTPAPCQDVPPDPPTRAGSLTISSVGTDYVAVRISSISKATGYEIVWRRSSVSSIEDSMDVGSSGKYTIDGLEPETDYVFNYRAYNDDGYGPFMSSGKPATTLSERPDDWSWWTRIQRDGDIDISADEWNAFCERINEFREYCGERQYSFTEVSSDDYISAAVVNQAVWAIQGMSPPRSPPSQVTSGQSDVTAAFFNGLMYALNSIE